MRNRVGHIVSIGSPRHLKPRLRPQSVTFHLVSFRSVPKYKRIPITLHGWSYSPLSCGMTSRISLLIVSWLKESGLFLPKNPTRPKPASSTRMHSRCGDKMMPTPHFRQTYPARALPQWTGAAHQRGSNGSDNIIRKVFPNALVNGVVGVALHSDSTRTTENPLR